MGRKQNGLERALGGKAVGEDIPFWHVADRKAGHCAPLRDTWLLSTSSFNDSISSNLILSSHLGTNPLRFNTLLLLNKRYN